MIGSGIVWRMAWSNLRKQWKQTLLTIAAGAIGAMLIAVSFVNYESVRISGEQWMETRLGEINWKLTPSDGQTGGFDSHQLAELNQSMEESWPDYRMLPYVGFETTLLAGDSGAGEGGLLKSVLALGFPMEQAARFEEARAELWRGGLGDDEIIVTEETASLLGVTAGDVLSLIAGDATMTMRIREVAAERGLTGFREHGAYSGTVIVSETTARDMAGAAEGFYPAILAGSINRDVPDYAMFILPELKYEVQFLKSEYRLKLERLNFTMIIGIISLVAIASSMLFMRQVLVMIADSRREIYGVLRAIGLSARQVSGMFAAEALLLSLLSAVAGAAMGIGAGYGLVSLFYGKYGEELHRMTGEHIRISPHISSAGAVLLFVAVFLFLAIVSLLAARKAGAIPVVEALRGGAPGSRKPGRRKRAMRWIWLGLGLYLTGVHVYLAFVDPPDLDGGAMLWITFSWLGACCMVLYALIWSLGVLSGVLRRVFGVLGIPALSVMLAMRYPRSQGGRTYTMSLLFALIMMIVTFTVTLMSLIMYNSDVEQTPQTVLGNGGYAPYRSEAERDDIMTLAREDAFIAEHISGMMVSQPFMLDMTESGNAQAIVPVTEELLQRELPPLAERSPQFGNDLEAWEQVLRDPNAIMLPYHFKKRDNAAAMAGLQAGDTITLPVYQHEERRMMGSVKKVATEKTFTVAGFVRIEAHNHLIDYYGTTYMNADVTEELRPLGFKWPNQSDLGFVLFDFDYRDVALGQALEERFAINGVLGFTVPYLNNSATQLMNGQLGYGFVGCAVFSGIISLMGLAVVQYRTVRERGKVIGMLRCIGVPGKQIYWMFVLEGLVISAVGLLTGWGVGASGGRLFVEAASKDLQDYQSFEPSYPLEVMLPVVGGLLLLSLLINIAPARSALKLKAAKALRANDE